MVANHFSPRLSTLDLLMARFVPPGGNWKDIPSHVPSKRLDQIRESFAAGEGSRSTYYGRLNANDPSYTINTYFGRPGNGCFLHYDFMGGQHRTISQREAARLQSFPDHYEFLGSKTSINKQIGNAVPPILSYQIARKFSHPGSFIDLFCGAGGLSLGFHWAGWKQVVANDIEKSFLETYRKNLNGKIIFGDINQPEVFREIVAAAKLAPASGPTIVLGGPPCQGFSTAGNRRSMDDARNHLFKQYAKLLESLNVDAFVFENVPGILNMHAGNVFNEIRDTLERCGFEIAVWILRAEEFGTPQRRTRVFIVGTRGLVTAAAPSPISSFTKGGGMQFRPRIWSVEEALNDLPSILAGEDGSHLPYRAAPSNAFQQFMRGQITAAEFVDSMHRAIAA